MRDCLVPMAGLSLSIPTGKLVGSCCGQLQRSGMIKQKWWFASCWEDLVVPTSRAQRAFWTMHSSLASKTTTAGHA